MNYEIHGLKNFFRLLRLDNFDDVEALRWKDRYLSDLSRGQAPDPVGLAASVLCEMYLSGDNSDRINRGVARFLDMVDEAPMANGQRAALLLKLGPVCDRDTLSSYFSGNGCFAVEAQALNDAHDAPAPFFYTEIMRRRVNSSGFGFMASKLCQWDRFMGALVDRLGFIRDADLVASVLEDPLIAARASLAPFVFNDEALSSLPVIEFALKHDKFRLSAHGRMLKHLVENQGGELVTGAVDAIFKQIMRINDSDALKASTLGSVRLWFNDKVDQGNAETIELANRVNGLLDAKRHALLDRDASPSFNP